MSGIIYESETGEGLGRFEIDLADDSHRLMTVNITEEGIIMDVYQTVNVFDNPNAEPVDERAEYLGTMGMMFDEWADFITDSPRNG